MPRHAQPGYRAAIEAALMPEERAVLRAWCRVWGVCLERWQGVPAFQAVFETAAALNVQAELVAAEGYSPTAALPEACARLGLPYDTIRGRVRDGARLAVERMAA